MNNLSYIIILSFFSFVFPQELDKKENISNFKKDFVEAAINRTNYDIIYDNNYFSIDYPNGDIPKDKGVCTDVIIRSYRAIGTDLQVLVHEDMSRNFNIYPSNRIWGHTKPYSSIDHRRVPNLQVFFERHGKVLEISNNKEDYSPGDLVTWKIHYNPKTKIWSTDHIGIVVDNLMIVHNIGGGVVLEDVLFEYKITGHYRYVPNKYK